MREQIHRSIKGVASFFAILLPIAVTTGTVNVVEDTCGYGGCFLGIFCHYRFCEGSTASIKEFVILLELPFGKMTKGVRSIQPVQLLDIYITLVAMTGGKAPSGIDGISVLALPGGDR